MAPRSLLEHSLRGMGQTRATSSGLAGRELKRYAVAIAVSGVALALTVAFRNRLAPTPFLLLYLAVTASAWYGGPWPGVLAAVVSVLGVEFVASQQHLAATDPALYLRLAVFFGVAMLTSGMSGSLNGAKRRAEARASEAVAASNRLRQVAGITADLVLHQTLDDLLHGLLGRVEKALDVDEVTILLLDGDGLHLTVRASLPSEQPAEGGFRVPVGRGFAGRVAATQASSIINDTTTIELLNPYLRATTRSLLGVPLLSDTGLVGVLHVGTKLRRNFTADDQAFLELLATRAALAIDAARVRESERAALAAAELARTDAERANRVKGDFLAHMSHELRTPLNAIAGYVELLEMGIRGPVTREQIEDLGRIRRSQQHLLSLINEVLEYAKIEAGHLDFELSDVDVDVLVSRVAELVEPQARLTGIELSCISRESHLLARADEGRAEQILINLLSNAVKFTGAAGRVSVEAEVVSRGGADDAVAIHVRDTGIGIAAEQTEAVFEPFVQVDQTLSRRAGGTGLGLAISRELARAMGGDLIVESDLGFGSRFTLILPRQAFAGRGLLPARNAAARVP